jgi:hypothetical protein
VKTWTADLDTSTGAAQTASMLERLPAGNETASDALTAVAPRPSCDIDAWLSIRATGLGHTKAATKQDHAVTSVVAASPLPASLRAAQQRANPPARHHPRRTTPC